MRRAIAQAVRFAAPEAVAFECEQLRDRRERRRQRGARPCRRCARAPCPRGRSFPIDARDPAAGDEFAPERFPRSAATMSRRVSRSVATIISSQARLPETLRQHLGVGGPCS